MSRSNGEGSGPQERDPSPFQLPGGLRAISGSPIIPQRKKKAMDTNEQIYDALSDALGDTGNDDHDGAVSAIGTLKHQRDSARRMVVNAREAISEAIGRDAVSPSLVKDADGAHLVCSVCRALLEEKVDPEYTTAGICPSGQGCGELESD